METRTEQQIKIRPSPGILTEQGRGESGAFTFN